MKEFNAVKKKKKIVLENKKLELHLNETHPLLM